MTEQQGKSEGGKEPPSRSINQFFELFQSSKNCLSGAKRLFRHAEKPSAAAAAEGFCMKSNYFANTFFSCAKRGRPLTFSSFVSP